MMTTESTWAVNAALGSSVLAICCLCACSSPDGGNGGCALASEAQLLATPRAERDLEQLALALSGGFTANEDMYDRLVRDVLAIRSAAPEVANIRFRSFLDTTVILYPTAATFEQMEQGTYDSWDCLNESYGMRVADLFGSPEMSYYSVLLKSDKVLDVLPIAEQYDRLPGVDLAGPAISGFDGPTICVTPSPATWHYVFDQAGGDCPSGCNEHIYHYFTVEADGTQAAIGTWDDSSATTRPPWVDTYAAQDVCEPWW